MITRLRTVHSGLVGGSGSSANTSSAAPATNGGNGLAIGSLVLGIVGVVVGFFVAFVGIIAGVVGLILGIIARRRGLNRGMVLAGIILSAIAIVIGIIGIILAGVLVSQMMQNQ